MATVKITGVLKRKAGNGKGFLLEGDENWFNASEEAAKYLAKIELGTRVGVEFFKKGIKREVTIITEAKDAVKSEVTSDAKFTCAECGAPLKDGKYKKCYMCNKKSAAKVEVKSEPTAETTTTASADTKTWSSSGTKYGSAEDIAGKEVGCSAGVAGSILAGRPEDAETLLEMFRFLTNGILEHIRSLK